MCSVVLSVCLLQQRWLVKCKGPLSFPADLARRRRNIAGQACLFFATAAAVWVCAAFAVLACLLLLVLTWGGGRVAFVPHSRFCGFVLLVLT